MMFNSIGLNSPEELIRFQDDADPAFTKEVEMLIEKAALLRNRQHPSISDLNLLTIVTGIIARVLAKAVPEEIPPEVILDLFIGRYLTLREIDANDYKFYPSGRPLQRKRGTQ